MLSSVQMEYERQKTIASSEITEVYDNEQETQCSDANGDNQESTESLKNELYEMQQRYNQIIAKLQRTEMSKLQNPTKPIYPLSPITQHRILAANSNLKRRKVETE